MYIASRRPGPAIDRDELHSEIMLALLTNLRRGAFRGASVREFNVYLYTIVRNQVARAFKMHRPQISIDEASDTLESAGSVSDRVAAQDLADRIFQALDPRCRRLLKLKFMFDWTDLEIADYSKMTKNATSTAISRCLKRTLSFPFVKQSM